MQTEDNRRDWKERNQGPMPQQDPASKHVSKGRDFAKPGESDGPNGDTDGELGPGGSILPEIDAAARAPTRAATSEIPGSRVQEQAPSTYRVITLDRHMTMIETASHEYPDDEAAIAAARMALGASPNAAFVEVWDRAGRIHRETQK